MEWLWNNKLLSQLLYALFYDFGGENRGGFIILFCFSFMTVSGGRNQVTPRLLQIKAILFIYSSGKQGYMIPQYLFKYDQTAWMN